jgi:hypothetical protein
VSGGVVLFRDTFADAVIPWKVTAGTATLARTTTDGEVHAGSGAYPGAALDAALDAALEALA